MKNVWVFVSVLASSNVTMEARAGMAIALAGVGYGYAPSYIYICFTFPCIDRDFSGNILQYGMVSCGFLLFLTLNITMKTKPFKLC